ncbi:phosphatidylserine decarboxylase proenzyme, mitochondrial-like isoform X1 [Mya arenaria]|uniref:phosphatidylserine decarboxylase proenzyme, mitochondrial-like isoform X1 n=1 Tax=Mya arenaria TaxID=6604 RepID=UPI0022DED627|nr:phosphatidylserine decarboxylase proenzyme, mitochondrial-like isoform X1 [Mya arenaria]
MLEFIWPTFISQEAMISYPSDWVETVAYNPSLLYSTLIIAILLTKGYGRNIVMAIGKKVLHEPTRKLWRAIRAIKPRQIVYYGLKWGIPLYQLKDLLLLHRNLLKKRPGRQQRRCSQKNAKKLTLKTRSLNSTVGLYRAMPLKAMSRVWGKMTCWDLPLSLRKPLLGLYCRTFHVNLDEALDGDLQNYQNLSELFRRELKPGVRVVDKESQMTSPADGRILNYGKVQNGVVEQVKGVNYSIKGFLGPMPSENEEISTKPQSDTDYHDRLGIKPGHDLYHCIIYLAPGDYHRFHSPSDWTVTQRRHFPGELLSVNPSVARWIQGLFNLNERVVYSGSWKHGFYSYTAVGATNVGSIKVYFDEDLSTNAGKPHPSHIFYDKTFSDSVPVSQGEMVGEFNLGSTIVLLFEAPSDFKFNLNTGQKVQFGQSLGGFK